jgi:hypothetical protein
MGEVADQTDCFFGTLISPRCRGTGGLPHDIVSAFRAFRFVPYLGHDNCDNLQFGKSAATTIHHWNSVPHVDEEMGRGEEP